MAGKYIESQIPIMQNGDFYYPLTTAKQTILPDGRRLGGESGLNLTADDVNALSVDLTDVEYGTATGINADTLGGKSISDIMLMMYPVGSIYMSSNSVSPQSLFGGTWEQLKNRFLLGAGDSYASGSTGGEASVVLNNNNLPYMAVVVEQAGEANEWTFGVWDGSTCTAEDWIATFANASGYGYGESLNNMPPYLAVYMWKRIA